MARPGQHLPLFSLLLSFISLNFFPHSFSHFLRLLLLSISSFSSSLTPLRSLIPRSPKAQEVKNMDMDVAFVWVTIMALPPPDLFTSPFRSTEKNQMPSLICIQPICSPPVTEKGEKGWESHHYTLHNWQFVSSSIPFRHVHEGAFSWCHTTLAGSEGPCVDEHSLLKSLLDYRLQDNLPDRGLGSPLPMVVSKVLIFFMIIKCTMPDSSVDEVPLRAKFEIFRPNIL